MASIPSLTTEQMIEVDRAMLQDYHISLLQMMENAGRCLADLARSRFLGGDPRGKNIVILAGTGGNGGGALVSARRLHNWGAAVTVLLTKPAAEYGGVPAQQLDALQRMGVKIEVAESMPRNQRMALIVDGLIGYSLRGAPRGSVAELIRWTNRQSAPILSLDTPSGLDTGTGAAHEPSIRAGATLMLALPKVGLLQPQAAEFTGELYLADISVPAELYQKLFGLAGLPIFAVSDIIRVDRA